MSTDRYEWLDDVIRRIGLAYDTLFELVPEGRVEETNEKHGRCQKFTYRFVFHEGVQQVLPNEDGPILMKVIKMAALVNRANPTLIPTMIKGKHDFCDWGWTPEGAEMWIFLKPEKVRGTSL